MKKMLTYGCIFFAGGDDDWDDTAANEQGEDSGTPAAAQGI